MLSESRSPFRSAALLLLSVLIHGCSYAASFDCGKARTEQERWVCGDQALSRTDGELAQAYQAGLASLSPRGKALMQASQRGWLHFIGTVCTVLPSVSQQKVRSPVECMKREYTERLRQLSDVGLKRGPYTFIRIDVFRATPVAEDDATGSRTGFHYEHLAYPQIDTPDTPSTRAWNEHVEKALPISSPCESASDDDLDYKLGLSNARLISVLWSEAHYCHGTPHGFGGPHADNQVVFPLLRDVVPSDLFASDAVGAAQLRLDFWRALQRQGWVPIDEGAKQSILDAATSPENWLLTEDGLTANFGSYAGGCYVCTPRPVTLPWGELRPLLAADAIAP